MIEYDVVVDVVGMIGLNGWIGQNERNQVLEIRDEIVDGIQQLQPCVLVVPIPLLEPGPFSTERQ